MEVPTEFRLFHTLGESVVSCSNEWPGGKSEQTRHLVGLPQARRSASGSPGARPCAWGFIASKIDTRGSMEVSCSIVRSPFSTGV